MKKSNVIKLNNLVRYKFFLLKLSLEELALVVYGFSRVDEKIVRYKKLIKMNFEAFWDECGPLVRVDVRDAYKTSKECLV